MNNILCSLHLSVTGRLSNHSSIKRYEALDLLVKQLGVNSGDS